MEVGGAVNYLGINLKYMPAGLVVEIDVTKLSHDVEIKLYFGGCVIISYMGDALDQGTFRKCSYDLIRVNSIIEHVGNLSAQKKITDSIIRLKTSF
ncbi:MAG: hypothetical protein ACI9LU_000749 [Polaribacter sp.]